MGEYTLARLWASYRRARVEKEALGQGAGREGEEAARKARRLRDRLVVNYSPLVKYVTGRMVARTGGNLDAEDAASWGVMGLVDAVETFREDRGARFETYAIHKIRWSIMDGLRREDPLPHRAHRRARETESARATLAQRHGRTPAEEEVAAELGVELREHLGFLESYSRAAAVSLDERRGDDGRASDPLEAIADRLAADPEAEAQAADTRGRLVRAMETLGERERVVVSFYFYEGLTLREIGKALGISEGRVSQILRAALLKMRRLLSRG